ncbi:hypothetical protein ZWY2020_011978 [Hordeum vulgare]|nr:hypothetical protein ZWY2020_011978 [Hordeum vulgare]
MPTSSGFKTDFTHFDLPHVISDAQPYPGVEHVGGDMFESVPSGGDAILMKWILNCFSDQECAKLLKNCYDALPDHGKVINVECILPAKPDATNSAQGLISDVCLLAYSPVARKGTSGTWRSWPRVLDSPASSPHTSTPTFGLSSTPSSRGPLICYPPTYC